MYGGTVLRKSEPDWKHGYEIYSEGRKLRWEESKKKENIRHCVEELCIDNQKLRPNEVKRTQRKRQRCKNRKK